MLAPETKEGMADPSVYSFPVSQHVLSGIVSAESMRNWGRKYTYSM